MMTTPTHWRAWAGLMFLLAACLQLDFFMQRQTAHQRFQQQAYAYQTARLAQLQAEAQRHEQDRELQTQLRPLAPFRHLTQGTNFRPSATTLASLATQIGEPSAHLAFLPNHGVDRNQQAIGSPEQLFVEYARTVSTPRDLKASLDAILRHTLLIPRDCEWHAQSGHLHSTCILVWPMW